jgi:plastocyanin
VSTSPAALAFDQACLAAPAGEKVTVAFDNRSPSVPHNLSVATEGLVDVLFEGDIVTGPKKITYNVPSLDAGTYVFYCKVHPTQMNGTYVVA